MGDLVFKLKTLTPIWTGGVEGKTDQLHLTGIKGSIRWWYEALIRGLDYYACDPTDDSSKFKKCELDIKKLDKNQPLPPQVKKTICPACHMFGCTGWSGKFILKITEPNTTKPIESLLSKGIQFDLHFKEKKKFDTEEEMLIKMTLKLIVDYAAIGGRTVFKPSEEPHKNINSKIHHYDFGILKRDNNSKVPLLNDKITNYNMLSDYLKEFKFLASNSDWPNLKYFWFAIGCFIARDSLNAIVARNDNGKYNDPSELQVFLGGYGDKDKANFSSQIIENRQIKSNQIESKKIFSFHGQSSGETRCFGYARKDNFDEVICLFEKYIDSSAKIICGTEVLSEL